MSIFGFYFVGSLLGEMKWPRKLGMFKGDGYDTFIVDSTIDAMVDWAAAIGAGRPKRGLQVISEMFRDRWDAENPPDIKMFVETARKDWQPDARPCEVVKPVHLAQAFGKSISVKDFQDSRLRTALEQYTLFALLLGLANPKSFATWYTGQAAEAERSLPFARHAGLEVDSLPSLEEFIENSDQILDSYEREVGPLPSIPTRLLSDAQALGWRVS
jgi:hypothetical protein